MRLGIVLVPALLLALAQGCGVADDCAPGERGCSCTVQATCAAGLSCEANVCIQHFTPGATATGDTPAVPTIGSGCASDAECGAGLRCITAASTELGGQGAPGGYCSLACTSNTQCQAVDAQSLCGSGIRLCLRTCLTGAPGAMENKCLNRSTVVCARQGDLLDQRTQGLCFPQCGSDDDCPGRVCNLASGFCADGQATGAPVGAACSSANECAGRECIGGYCSAPCFGGRLLDGCGFGARASVREAACVSGAASFGDVGFCVALCDEAADCANPIAECLAGADATGRAGYCGTSAQSP